MDRLVELEMLHDQALDHDKAIESVQREIQRALEQVAEGSRSIEHATRFLRDRFEIETHHKHELEKVLGWIQELEAPVPDQQDIQIQAKMPIHDEASKLDKLTGKPSQTPEPTIGATDRDADWFRRRRSKLDDQQAPTVRHTTKLGR